MSVSLRRVLASVLAWLVGAAAAVGVGLLALSWIGDGLTTTTAAALQPETVTRDPSAAPSSDQPSPTVSGASPSPGGSVSPKPSRSAPVAAPTGAQPDRVVTSKGGSAVARCTNGLAYLVSWSPNPGYRVDDVLRGPAVEARVQFEAVGSEVLLRVKCLNGVPQS